MVRGLRRLSLLVVAAAVVGCGTNDASPEPSATRDWDLPEHLVFISLDTLRADRLGCHGYDRETSPNLDAFAARSLQFMKATAAASNTTPSHMSMFTGVLPPVHGQYNIDLKKGTSNVALSTSIPMIAERLSDAGYATYAYTDGGYLTKEMNFHRGFDVFDRKSEKVDSKVDRVLERLDTLDPAVPTFFFFHTYEIHAPYLPPREHDVWSDPNYDGPMRAVVDRMRERGLGGPQGATSFLPKPNEATDADREYLSDLYDGGIRFTDEQVARVLDFFNQPPWRDTTAIIVLSDHGEAFMEHGRFAHSQLYEPIVHVPTMIHIPGGPVGKVMTNVSGVDVTPTILDLLELPPARIIDGVSMLAQLDASRPVLSFNGPQDAGAGATLRIGDDKVIRNRTMLPWERYDLDVDPRELSPVVLEGNANDELVAALDEQMATMAQAAELLTGGEEGERGELSPETLESLRALGYFEDESFDDPEEPKDG